jgi:hypothetical protein
MIKANELRIGNIVERNGLNVRVTSIGAKDSMTDGGYSELKNIEPIKLTPEILEKADFVGGYENYYDHKKLEGLQIQIDENGCWLLNDEFTQYYGKPFKYLHQLQNLFYSLTGEELNIEL